MPDPRFRRLESIRNRLQKNNDYILINDFGAGSRASVLHKRKVKDIVKSASSRPRFSRLLFALAAHFQPEQIIELGTSLRAAGKPFRRLNLFLINMILQI
jgi:hypothetical protein